MSVRSWISSRLGLERKSAPSAPVPSSPAASVQDPFATWMAASPYAMFLDPQEITPMIAWRMYKNISPLAKVVDLIADEVSRLKPLIRVGGQPVDNHPILADLTRPGFNRTRARFIKEIVVQLLVTGQGNLHVIGLPGFMPRAFDVLKSHFVTSVQAPDMWPGRYIYSEGTRHIDFDRDANPRDFRWIDGQGFSELVPVYDMDGDRRGIGLSRLNAIKADVEVRLKGLQHNASLLDNGARIGGILNYKDGLNEDQAASVRSQIQSLLSGASNAGKIMVTSGSESDFNALTQSAKDMDFNNLIRIVEDAIVARYNVPITLFRPEAQTNNNYETAWYIFYEMAVLPTFELIYSGIAQVYNNRLRPEEQVEIVHDALTNGVLAKQAASRARELFGAHLLSRNEARATIGYEPVLGGDTIYGPMGEVPQGEDFFTATDEHFTAEDFQMRLRERGLANGGAASERPGQTANAEAEAEETGEPVEPVNDNAPDAGKDKVQSRGKKPVTGTKGAKGHSEGIDAMARFAASLSAFEVKARSYAGHPGPKRLNGAGAEAGAVH